MTSDKMPYMVHRLRHASVNLAGQFNPPTFADTRIDVFGYLAVSTDNAVLIDTGVGAGNGYVDRTFAPDRSSIDELLADFELKVDDITLVVNTHLHFDHCGNNRLFPDTRTVVQAQELKSAAEKFYTVRDWYDFEGASLDAVSGETEIVPGIRVIPTPGHTPGHQSVSIEGVDGVVLIAAQAAFTADEYRRGGDASIQAHAGFERQYDESIDRLKSIRASRVLFSHDSVELSQLNSGL